MGKRVEKGARVGAILSGKDGKVLFLGFGTYAGEEVPPNRGEASMATILHEAEAPNPKIDLDNGKVVYGSECWWGPESVIQKRLDAWEAEGWEIIEVDIDEQLGLKPDPGAESEG